MTGARLLLLVALAGAVAVNLPSLSPPTAVAKVGRRVNYTVQRGDTLIKIARRFHVSVKQIQRWNRLKGARIHAGQRLRVVPPEVSVGKLVGGVQLPPGEAYYLKDPDESWADPHTAQVLLTAIEAWRGEHPGSVPVVIGDLSRREGGWFPPHVSHQTGHDIDIGLFASRNRRLTHMPKLPGKELDAKKTWDFVEALVNTGQVELILLDRQVQARLFRAAEREGHSRAWLERVFQWPRGPKIRAGLIRHSRGHADHLHVRIKTRPVAEGPLRASPP